MRWEDGYKKKLDRRAEQEPGRCGAEIGGCEQKFIYFYNGGGAGSRQLMFCSRLRVRKAITHTLVSGLLKFAGQPQRRRRRPHLGG